MNLVFSGSGLVGAKINGFDFIFELVEYNLPKTIFMYWISSRIFPEVSIFNSVKQQSDFLTNIFKGNCRRVSVKNQFVMLVGIVILIIKFLTMINLHLNSHSNIDIDLDP